MKTMKLSLAVAVSICLALAACKGAENPDVLLKAAKVAIENKDIKAAEIHLKNVIQSKDSAEARMLLGKVYGDAGDFRSAEKELRKAIETGGSRDEIVPMLLDALFQNGEYQKLLDDVQNLAVTDKNAKAAVATLVGKAQIAMGKTEAAQNTLTKALLDAPTFAPLLIARVSAQIAKGDKKTAKADLDQIIKDNPTSSDAYIVRGDLELADGNLAEAKSLYIKVAQLAPSNALARAKLAAIFIDSNDFKSADEQINELQKVSPNSPGTMYLRALLSYRKGNLPEARDYVLTSLKGAPDYIPSMTLAGNIYLSLGSFESSERYARMVIERAPDLLQGYRLLGATFLKTNAPERALQAVQPLLNKGIEDSAILSIAGEAALKINDPVKAAGYFEKASKLDPKDSNKRTGLALSRMASGDRDKAFAELEEAVLLDTQNYQADFALIMARVRDKQFDKALEAVTRLEKKMPKSAIPPNLRGLVSLAQNDEPRAKLAFEAALKIDPLFFAASANLSNIELKGGQKESAKKRFEDILKLDPKNADALIALARHTQLTGGTNKDAVTYLLSAKTANPGSVQPVMALANFYISTNQPKESIVVLQEALTANPDRQDLLNLLGTSFIQINDRALAIDTYEKLVAINPKAAEAHYRLGDLRATSKDETAALNSYKKASELMPLAAGPKIGIATILIRQGKIEQAKLLANELKKDLPNSAAGLTLEGDLASLNNQPAEAVAAYKKALLIEKQTFLGVKLHRLLQTQNKQSEAQTLLNDWFKTNPSDLTMRLYAAEQAMVQTQWKNALEHYDVVIKLDPKHAIALNNSAWAWHKLGDSSKGVILAEQAFSVTQSSPPIIDTLGTILIQTGSLARGQELLKQAVSLAPKQFEYRLHLAEAFVKSGDVVNAKKELETILKDAPPGSIRDAAKTMSDKI
jgi:cellulose synthase operon protein C